MENKEISIEEEFVELNLDKIKSLIPKYSSEKICEMIVCDRYFGMSKEVNIMCMEELAARRQAGDLFQFEQYIEDSLAKLPPLNFNIPDLRTTLQQMIKGKK